MSPILYSIIGGASMLLITSIYRLAESGIRKRITVRSPEMAAVMQIVPTVNMMVPVLGSLLIGQQASLEALKNGKCNGNVDKALSRIERARAQYDDYLVDQASVDEPKV
jgi:hypothetical protein